MRTAPHRSTVGVVVQAYRNLHHPGVTYSLRDRRSQRVVDRAGVVILSDAVFRVQPGGRARVLREKRKNVHAYVQGTVSAAGPATGWRRARYNPYHLAEFVDAETGVPVHAARWARLDASGVSYIT